MLATRLVLLLALFAAMCSTVCAQGVPGEEFRNFVAANEKFGRKLLRDVQSSARGQNVAVSPLPVSSAFALVRQASSEGATIDEIQRAFEWSGIGNLRDPSRMLLSIFQKPAPPKPPRHARSRKDKVLTALLSHESPEEFWISTTFSYRGKNAISGSFADMGAQDFGVEFRSVSREEPEENVVSRSQDSGAPLPKVHDPENDFWIVSTTHLRTRWAGNTFSMGKQKDDDFILGTGQREQVRMLVSQLDSYWHGQTKDFETIELVCDQAYLQIVLPQEQTDLEKLEAKLIEDDGSLHSSLKPDIGDVEIPKFSFQFEADMRLALGEMGVHRIFENPDSLSGLVSGPEGAMLRGVSQRVEIEVNEEGIRANAGTVTNGVYGGILGGQYSPFHMVVNRPFLFFIRDNVTGSLLFAGAVMDPAKH